MIFNAVNLYWLTCIQKIEVPLQVVNRAQNREFKKFKFKFEVHLNQVSTVPKQ
jgi:hypothetical protein